MKTSLLFSLLFLTGHSLYGQFYSGISKKSHDVKTIVPEHLLPNEWKRLPSDFSLQTFAPPYLQQRGGTCVTFSVVYAARSIAWNFQRAVKQKEAYKKFNPYYVHHKLSSSCDEGMFITEALDYLREYGCAEMDSDSIDCAIVYTTDSKAALQYKISGYEELFNSYVAVVNHTDTSEKTKSVRLADSIYAELGFVSLTERICGTIKKQLYSGHPVVAAFSLYPSYFNIYGSGDLWKLNPLIDTIQVGSHGLVIIGWDDQKYGGAFEIMNSNEANNRGFHFWIPYRDMAFLSPECYVLYDFGIENGLYISKYPNGVVREKGNVVQSKKSGKWLLYDNDGHLISEITYLDGFRHGEAISYHKNGTPAQKATFNRGKINKAYTELDERGKKTASGEFLMGKGNLVYHKKEFRFSGVQVNGYATGTWQLRRRNNLVASTEYASGYKNGYFLTFTKRRDIVQRISYRMEEYLDPELEAIKEAANTTIYYYKNGKLISVKKGGVEIKK